MCLIRSSYLIENALRLHKKTSFIEKLMAFFLSFWESHETKAMRGQNSDLVLKQMVQSYHCAFNG